ncbi:hypothetical protein MKW92_018976, partial [Papaver armeniacum]
MGNSSSDIKVDEFFFCSGVQTTTKRIPLKVNMGNSSSDIKVDVNQAKNMS